MKKLFGFMMLAGILLAVVTAGGVDSGVIDAKRVLMQSVLAGALIYFGNLLKGRAEA